MVALETDLLKDIKYNHFVACAKELAFLANPTRDQFNSFAQYMSYLAGLYCIDPVSHHSRVPLRVQRLHEARLWYQKFAGLNTLHASEEDMNAHNFKGCIVDSEVVTTFLRGEGAGGLRADQEYALPTRFLNDKTGWQGFVLLSSVMMSIPKPSTSMYRQIFSGEDCSGDVERLDKLAEELMERMSAKSFRLLKNCNGFSSFSPQDLERILDETGLKYVYQLPRDGTIPQIEPK